MVVEFKDLVALLDASSLPNQGVPAQESLVIKFGTYVGTESHIHEALDQTSVILDVTKDSQVVSIELH